MKYKSTLIAFIVLLFAGVFGCSKDFEKLDSIALKKRFEQSHHDSASGWWYLGEKGNYYHLVLKYPTRRYYYKVNKKYIRIKLNTPNALTMNEFRWSNIKSKDIVYLP